jgi:hypothetical protein
MYFNHLLHDLMLALERNSAELEVNNSAMRVLLRRIEGGEIALADAEEQRNELIAVSDRLQLERLQLVSTAQDVRLRAADSPQNTQEFARRGSAEGVGDGHLAALGTITDLRAHVRTPSRARRARGCAQTSGKRYRR